MFIKDYMFFESYRLNKSLKSFGVLLNNDFFKKDKSITIIKGVTNKTYTEKPRFDHKEPNKLEYKLTFTYSNKFKKYDMNKFSFEAVLKYDSKIEKLQIPQCMENIFFKDKIEKLNKKFSLLKFIIKKEFLDVLLNEFITIDYKISFSYKKTSKFIADYEMKKDDIEDYISIKVLPSVLSFNEPFYSGFDDLIKYNSSYKVDLNKNEDIFNEIIDRLNNKYNIDISLDDDLYKTNTLLKMIYIE